MKKTKVFMILPFDSESLGLYEFIKDQFKDSYDFVHAGDLDNQQNILKDIVFGICKADIILADLTGLNPNVFYELGLCHALGKKVISITQSIDELPFDIKQYRANQYSPHVSKISDLIDELKKLFEGAIDGKTSFGTPISDYAPREMIITMEDPLKIETSKQNTEEESNSEASEIEGEKGFLDFVTEIAEDTASFTTELNDMIFNLDVMTKNIVQGNSEIDRVKSLGGSGVPSFTRDVARKVAVHVTTFDKQMKEHNSVLNNYWSNIENNCLDLIDNKFMETNDNKIALKDLLIGLYSMKNATIKSNQSTYGMVSSFSAIRGLERRLNQAVNSLENQMTNYLGIMENLIASVDRIIEKGKTIVGEIDFSIQTENNNIAINIV